MRSREKVSSIIMIQNGACCETEITMRILADGAMLLTRISGREGSYKKPPSKTPCWSVSGGMFALISLGFR